MTTHKKIPVCIMKHAQYYPRTYKENGSFYPAIEFISKTISDWYFINNPQPTRGKARTLAIKEAKNLNQYKKL